MVRHLAGQSDLEKRKRQGCLRLSESGSSTQMQNHGKASSDEKDETSSWDPFRETN